MMGQISMPIDIEIPKNKEFRGKIKEKWDEYLTEVPF